MNSPAPSTDLTQQLIGEEEGYELTAYKDSRGLWTVGIGHLLDQSKDWTGYTITDAFTQQLFVADSAHARELCSIFPHADEFSDVRRATLTSMTFQLGAKPLHWQHFMAALTARDYPAAATAGRDSDWWRDQTRKRAEREMKMLETDQWVAHA